MSSLRVDVEDDNWPPLAAPDLPFDSKEVKRLLSRAAPAEAAVQQIEKAAPTAAEAVRKTAKLIRN